MGAYLVTGGAGFIGSHIAETLVRRGERVRILDDFSSGSESNLEPFRDRIEVVQGDIRDLETCHRAAAGIDHVIHQAALVSVPRSIEDPAAVNAVNITGTLNVLLAARNEGARSFIFASSSSVYGDDPELPKKEGQEGRPLSPYAVSKLTGEHYCRLFHQLYGLNTTALRYFNVFGPRQSPDSPYAAVIPRFISKLRRGEAPVIFGNGEQSRDFTFVSNVVAANLLASRAAAAAGGVYNVACGSGTTVNALVGRINDLLKTRVAPLYEAERPGDILHSYADISAARKAFAFEPAVGFEEGLELTVRWFLERS